MAHYRYTIDELQNEKSPDYMSDINLLRAIVTERKGDVTNPYSPLAKRLNDLYAKLDAKHKAGKKSL